MTTTTRQAAEPQKRKSKTIKLLNVTGMSSTDRQTKTVPATNPKGKAQTKQTLFHHRQGEQ
jgi:hypothetical protein